MVPLELEPFDAPPWFSLTFGGRQRIDVADEATRDEAVAQVDAAIRDQVTSSRDLAPLLTDE